MDQEMEKIQESLVSIGVELFRFKRVFEKAVRKLDLGEQTKYISQFSWFDKKVTEALNGVNLKIVNLEGYEYDPGMAITPLNIDDFEKDDKLYIAQMVEPIMMKNDELVKMGTVILGRVEQ